MGTTAEKLAYLADTKNAIKDAIVSNGIEVPDETTFRSYPEKIDQIVGQFDSTLDEIIGGEIIPTLDVQERLETINGITGDVSVQLDTLDSTKAAIAAAITEKGVEIPDGTPFGEYADKIEDIVSSGGGNKPITGTFDLSTKGGVHYVAVSDLGEAIEFDDITVKSILANSLLFAKFNLFTTTWHIEGGIEAIYLDDSSYILFLVTSDFRIY